jgi:hypothetical protein
MISLCSVCALWLFIHVKTGMLAETLFSKSITQIGGSKR